MGCVDMTPLRSLDLGNNWVVCDSGLPIGHGVPFVVASGNKLIAGTNFNGVYFSSDKGDYWIPVNDGLQSESFLPVWSLAIIDNYVFASVGTSLWRRPFSEITSVKRVNPAHLKEFELRQNYPNPFNPSTIISYHLSAASDINLKIYDILGREIIVLVNERQTAGDHSVKFNGSNLTSGVYFYSLTTENFHQTKELVLMK